MSNEQKTVSAPAEIFKAYDVRGIYGKQITAEVAELIGRGFARVLSDLRGKPTDQLQIGIGHDMRLSAEEISSAFTQGLLREGVSVFDIGLSATEMLYYLVGSKELDGGAAITASHNPKQYTGMKLVREGALPLSGDAGIGEVKRLIEEGFNPAEPTGSVQSIDISAEFQTAVVSSVDIEKMRSSDTKRLKVVADGGNGVASVAAGPVLDSLNIDLVKTYWTPDGNFPDHEPNPLLEENREAIIKKVLAEEADIGIAWDGDADRCFFIDGKGNFVDGDFLTAVLAESLLKKHGGAAVLYDVRASRAVNDVVKANGGTAHINRVGHAFFKARMREEDSIFGGEVSGHYYFKEFYCADTGTLPALLILERLMTENCTLADLIQPYRDKYFISGEINSTVSDAPAKITEIVETYSDGVQSDLDGVSIDYPEWHFNVRSSNTEPLLRLNLESLISPEHMAEKRDEVLALIRA